MDLYLARSSNPALLRALIPNNGNITHIVMLTKLSVLISLYQDNSIKMTVFS